MASSGDPPIPYEQVPSYDLTALPDPPEDYVFLGSTLKQYRTKAAQYFAKAGLDKIASYVLWGFSYGKRTRVNMIAAIIKVNYYMRPQYQINTENEMFDFQRDGGPRLLKYTVRPTPLPVSRHWPKLLSEAEIRQLGTSWYQRPADAPPDVPDHYLFQFLLPANPPGPVPGPATTLSTTAPLAPSAPTAPGSTQAVTQSPQSQQSSQSTHSHASSQSFDPSMVREAIEKALIKITYNNLERHPRAPSKQPVADRVASSAEHLNNVQVGAHTIVSHVRLNPLTQDFDPAGCFFPYRGRGPVWDRGSCVIDCVIVLGMLTMAGCTNADRADGAEEAFDMLTKAFIQATNMNWDAITSDESIRLRHSYYDMLCAHNLAIKRDIPVPVWTAWQNSTEKIRQFRMGWVDIPYGECGKCRYTESESVSWHSAGITPEKKPGDDYGVPMSEYLSRIGGTPTRVIACPRCGHAAGPQRVSYLTELPLRLAVEIQSNGPVLNHTMDQELVYWVYPGVKKTAKYRWLGGAYWTENHVRVIWNDDKRGEKQTGNLCNYDGQLAGGVIVGGLSPHSPAERVPPELVSHGIPIVIYELIMEPSEDILTAAAQTVDDMLRLFEQRQPFLTSHAPWTPERPPPRSLPLARPLPLDGERYRETPVDLVSRMVPQISPAEDLWAGFNLNQHSDQVIEDDPMHIDPSFNVFDEALASHEEFVNTLIGDDLNIFLDELENLSNTQGPLAGGAIKLLKTPMRPLRSWHQNVNSTGMENPGSRKHAKTLYTANKRSRQALDDVLEEAVERAIRRKIQRRRIE
ncbi:Uncharacterized protein PECH_006097 [Penicillium ucsense]|uniref:Uncharacterized protein n=1 Tax=Penicillium ucsense TaxID=2839758 RepID=A0A8J8WHK6_9EURO|nr:Uncharacterized protein PECM_008181 [Penicillium ucsense]KAF7735850.1 Uncharacterized protein PECH_006097 [Penicillium ucsense]